MTLIQKFIVALAFVVSLLVFMLGTWINSHATVQILNSTSAASARILQSFLEPRVQSLTEGGVLSDEDRLALKDYAESVLDDENFVAVKIWMPDGRTVFTNTPRTSLHHSSEEIQAALRGEIVGRLSDLDEDEHSVERDLGIRLYELYAPLRNQDTGEIIAIAELYQNADLVANSLLSSAKENWLRIFVAGFIMLSLLIAVVLSGSRLIDRQRADLEKRLAEQKALADANHTLRDRVGKAQQNAAEIDAQAHMRLGAELHDGACQLLGHLLLSVDRAEARIKSASPQDLKDALEMIGDARDAANQAMAEIRAVSSGLIAPHFDGLETVRQTIEEVIQTHQARYGQKVTLAFDGPDIHLSTHRLLALGRIIQEALTNAQKHAPDAAVWMDVSRNEHDLIICIEDDGPGLTSDVKELLANGEKLGVRGMLFRAESLAGRFHMKNRVPNGTEILIGIPLSDVSDLDQKSA